LEAKEARHLLVRATNWVGDAVMSIPALRALRARYAEAHISVLARPWVADLYRRERFADQVLLYEAGGGLRGWRDRWQRAREIRQLGFHAAILLTNSLDAALFVRMAGIPHRTGYNLDGRGWLLTQAVPPPRSGEIPPAEKYYYLELLRRAGILESYPASAEDPIVLEGAEEAAAMGRERLRALGVGTAPVIGVSPGATNSRAKQWLPERFAVSAGELAREMAAQVAVFGSSAELGLCEQVADALRGQNLTVHNFAGATTLAEFIELAAAMTVYLTNDSGAMHIASALNVPTVAIFGPTNEFGTPPSGSRAVVVREPVECMRCMYRDCPIDHRCMTLVSAEQVTSAARRALQLTADR
jgi:heptosyltransferase II